MTKSVELVAFAAKEQYDGVDYCITSPPPWYLAVFLGFQHYVVMLGTVVLIATILVPEMGGGIEEKGIVIQTFVFLAGINTLLQVHFGTRLPAVIEPSMTYIYPAIAIILSKRYAYIIDPYERFIYTMRALQGALICAACFQLALGFFGLWGVFIRFLSPLAAVPFVTLTALGLFYIAFPGVAKCIEIGLPTLILLLIFTKYLRHTFNRGFFVFDRFSVLILIIVVWIYAEILTAGGAYNNKPTQTQYSCRTDRAGLIKGTPWARFPYPYQWGAPIFHAGDCFIMIAASFVSLVESTGTLLAVSRFCGATFCPPSVFSRGIGWQGFAILIDGLCGSIVGSTVSVENAGLLALTRVGSRRVIMIAAWFMVFFGVLGKFGAVIASIPLPIFAALYCILYAYAASGGLCYLQYCNLNSLRVKFILGFAFFLGLSIPQYFREYEVIGGYGPVHTHSVAFNVIVNVIFSSPATVAAIIAYTLDLTHCCWDAHVRREAGCHWWEKFRSYRTDPRSEEFYSLPFRLNKYFPSH